SERGSDAGSERNGHATDPEAPREPRAVDRSGAAERHARESAGILASTDRDDADRAFHRERDDLVDAPRRVHHRHAERLRDRPLDRAHGRLTIQTTRAAEEVAGIEIPEHEIGVRHGRLVTAAAIARGSGIRAGAVWPH